MRPKSTAEYKSSELVLHPAFTTFSPSVLCDAYFSLKDDATGTAVALESDAIVTCNSLPMTAAGTVYSIAVTYLPGTRYTISLVRAIDGSSIVASQIVP